MNNDSARDKAMDKLVEAKLRSGLTPGSPSCPDAEILAAYVERALTSRERANCESHLASCAHCQEQVAVLVRLSEGDEPAGVQARAAAPARAAGMSWFRWAWAGPALAALLVIGIYVGGPFQHDIRQIPGPENRIQQPVRTQPATAPPAAKGGKNEITTAAASGSGSAQKQPAAENESLDMKARADTTAGKPERRQNEPPKVGAVGGTTAHSESPTKTPIAEPAQPAAAPVSPPPPAPTSSNVAPAVPGAIATPSERAALAKDDRGQTAGVRGNVAGGTGGGVSEERSNNPSANQPMGNFSTHRQAAQTSGPQSVPPPAAQKTTSSMSTLQDEDKAKKEAQATDLERDKLSENVRQKKQATGGVAVPATEQALLVTSAPATPAWRVGRHGLILKLNDEGKWKRQKSGVKAHLYAIASPSANVGWAVGQAGTILRTTDGGVTWSQVSNPTTEDLVQVTATSDQAASVTTRGGQTFTTTDGGNSWSGGGQ